VKAKSGREWDEVLDACPLASYLSQAGNRSRRRVSYVQVGRVGRALRTRRTRETLDRTRRTIFPGESIPPPLRQFRTSNRGGPTRTQNAGGRKSLEKQPSLPSDWRWKKVEGGSSTPKGKKISRCGQPLRTSRPPLRTSEPRKTLHRTMRTTRTSAPWQSIWPRIRAGDESLRNQTSIIPHNPQLAAPGPVASVSRSQRCLRCIAWQPREPQIQIHTGCGVYCAATVRAGAIT